MIYIYGNWRTDMTNKILLTEAEAAEYIGFSRSYLRCSRCTGVIPGKLPAPPYIKCGNRAIRYRLADLEVWLNKHKTIYLEQE